MRVLWGKYQDLPWEEIDTESKGNPIESLLAEYALAYGAGWTFEVRNDPDPETPEEIDS